MGYLCWKPGYFPPSVFLRFRWEAEGDKAGGAAAHGLWDRPCGALAWAPHSSSLKGSSVGPELTGVCGVRWGRQGGGTSGIQNNVEDVELVQGALVGNYWYRWPRPRSSWKWSAGVHLGAQARF